MTTYNKIFLTVIMAVSSLTNLSAMNGPIKRAKKVDQDTLNKAFLKRITDNGSLAEIQDLIDQGADLNTQSIDGATALIWAIYKGRFDVWQLLIENGADVNAQNEYGDTALVWTARHGQLAVCKGLIENGADLNVKNNIGYTALIWAVINGHFAMCKVLIENGADVNAKNKDGVTVLMVAAVRGHLERCKFLIENGADVNVRDNDGDTALIVAVKFGHLDVCKFLIENGADVNVRDNDGDTALIVAVKYGHLDICQLLIENGAAFNIINNEQESALCLAAEKGHTELCKSMIEKACLACPSKEETNVSRARFMKVLLCLQKAGMLKDLCFEILSIAPEFKGGFISVLYYDLCNGYAVGKRFNLLRNKLYEYTIGELKKFMDRAMKNVDDSNDELKGILDSTVLEENFGEVIRTNINERLGLMNAQAQEKIVKYEEL